MEIRGVGESQGLVAGGGLSVMAGISAVSGREAEVEGLEGQ